MQINTQTRSSEPENAVVVTCWETCRTFIGALGERILQLTTVRNNNNNNNNNNNKASMPVIIKLCYAKPCGLSEKL